jgi:hypothetical protein
MNHDPTTAYFDDLVRRAAVANAIPREAWSEARPNFCHQNCESFVQRFAGYEVVRGWLVFGGNWFAPHSVVRHTSSGRLIDITPDPSNSGAIPFVEHRGAEENFTVLRKGRDGGWLYPPLAYIPEAPASSYDSTETASGDFYAHT